MNLDSRSNHAPRASARRLGMIGLVAAGALLLGACASEPTPTPASSSPSPSPSISASPSPSTATEETPDEEPDAAPAPAPGDPAESRPVGITCADLITPNELYDYNANVSLVDTPATGTQAEQAVAAQGIACTYLNLTSNESTIVTASTPGPTAIAQTRSSLGAPSRGADVGGDGWYGGGTATVISGESIVTVSAPAFTALADATPLAKAAISKLG